MTSNADELRTFDYSEPRLSCDIVTNGSSALQSEWVECLS